MSELFIELFSEEIPSKLQVDARIKIKQVLEEKLKKKKLILS
jgi:glycyl-tRNA synthetase beta subunit